MAQLDVILEQLGEIHRSVGTLIERSEQQREETLNFTQESVRWRETMTSRMDNAVGRIAVLERGMAELQLTLDKTIMPLVTQDGKEQRRRQWRTGYIAGVSMVIGGLIALGGFLLGPLSKPFMAILNLIWGDAR